MSAAEDKDLSKPREGSGKARRTYASLQACRGFQHELPVTVDGAMCAVVSIAPMDCRSTWRHVGSGRSVAADALYEKEDE